MATTEINVNVKKIIETNRTPLSLFGGKTFGQDVFQPEARLYDPDYDNKIRAIKDAGNKDLCLNRSPRRFALRSTTITGIQIAENVAGETVLKINPSTDGSAEIEIPYNSSQEFGATTQELVKNFLKDSTKKAVFSDPAKLNEFLEQLNLAERSRLEKLEEEIKKAKEQITSTIARNQKIISDYNREINDSKPTAEVSVNVEA